MIEAKELKNEILAKETKKKMGWLSWILFGVLLLAFILFSCGYYLYRPPSNFEAQTITILAGLSASAIADKLEEGSIVRSADLLYFALIALHDPTDIKAGIYSFEKPLTTLEVADYLASARPSDTLVRLTFPEGMTVTDYAQIAERSLPEFDFDTFLEIASTSEGYMFPETYFVPLSFTTEDLFKLLTETGADKLSDYQLEIETNELDTYEVLILASILEKEANSEESMKMVSGILQNRLNIGMALQADATVGYILHKPLSELTPEDLDRDTPYNTYAYPGLPPTPIGNPGLQAIEAVLNPTPSKNFFYLTDENGDFYYAETYSKHLDNIERYLR